MSILIAVPENNRLWEPRLDLEILCKCKERLPKDIYMTIMRRTERLGDILEKIEEATGIEYPTVVIMPFTMVGYPLEPMIYFAIMAWGKPMELGSAPFVALSAPALVYGSDKALTGIFLHELMHYVARSVALALNLPVHLRTFISVQRSKDFMLRLAKIIIGNEKLLELYKSYEEGHEKQELGQAIESEWIEKDLPTLSGCSLKIIMAEAMYENYKFGVPIVIDGRLVNKYGLEVAKLIDETRYTCRKP